MQRTERSFIKNGCPTLEGLYGNGLLQGLYERFPKKKLNQAQSTYTGGTVQKWAPPASLPPWWRPWLAAPAGPPPDESACTRGGVVL